MALLALDGVPLIQIGAPTRMGTLQLTNLANTATLDAANEAIHMIGQVWTTDGQSHVIDTTGSSALLTRFGVNTFATSGSVVKVGLAQVDATTGPPARAVNASNVVTFDVSATISAPGQSIISSTYRTCIPDAGTLTVNNGDLLAFCVQMTARAGSDAVIVQCSGQPLTQQQRPCVTTYLAAAYANAQAFPNCVINFRDNYRGYFIGGHVQNGNPTTITYNNASANREYGNFFQLPFPVTVYGAAYWLMPAGNFDVALYTDPLSAPSEVRTVSVNAVQTAVSQQGMLYSLFPTPFSLKPEQPCGVMLRPTSATSLQLMHKTFSTPLHQESDGMGLDCYAINRPASGNAVAQNGQMDRFGIGLLVGAFEHSARASYGLGL